MSHETTFDAVHAEAMHDYMDARDELRADARPSRDEYEDPAEWLDTALDSPDEFDLARGEVAALEQADRYIEHIARIRRERAEAEALHRAAVDRLTERYRTLLERLNRDEAWYTAPVVGLHRALLADDPKRKTLRLPNGDVKSRTETRPRFDVVDVDAYVEWARSSAPHTLRPPVVKPDMRAVANVLGIGAAAPATVNGVLDVDAHRAVLPEVGEIVPGVIAHPPTTSYRIDVP